MAIIFLEPCSTYSYIFFNLALVLYMVSDILDSSVYMSTPIGDCNSDPCVLYLLFPIYGFPIFGRFHTIGYALF